MPLLIFLCPFWDEWDRDRVKYSRDRFIMQNSNLISSIACSFQNHQASANVYFVLVLAVPEPNKAYAHSEIHFPWMFLCTCGYLTLSIILSTSHSAPWVPTHDSIAQSIHLWQTLILWKPLFSNPLLPPVRYKLKRPPLYIMTNWLMGLEFSSLKYWSASYSMTCFL